MGCQFCGGIGGTLATIPGWGPNVFCTTCRKLFAPEVWMPHGAKPSFTFMTTIPYAEPQVLTCADDGEL